MDTQCAYISYLSHVHFFGGQLSHCGNPHPKDNFVTNTWSFYKRFAGKKCENFFCLEEMSSNCTKKSIATLLLFVENIG